ncbi:MAG: putative sulfate exporter family transporter [Psychrilyobacter sp.]|uniref:putative sulfate exporter family transporter n=1 Tax=Psychrilyobacter sp. TaxID=2586924 RepID=UPI003C745030
MIKKNGLGLGLTIILLVVAIWISKKFGWNEINTALILGIVVGNLFLGAKAYKFYPGFNFANKKILPIAITCLGVKINYIVLLDLGIKIIGFVFLIVLMLLFTAKYVAKFMGEKEEFGLILGSGGVACIAGSSEVLGQPEEEFAMAIIVMNILGLTAMVIMPSITRFLEFDATQSALYIGGTLSSFIHIIPAAYSIGENSLGLALLIKTGKLLFFPLILIYIAGVKQKKNVDGKKIESKKIKLPFFVKGFMAVGAFFTLLEYGVEKIDLQWYIEGVKYLKLIFSYTFKYLLMFALIGIGGKINIKTLLINGKRLIMYSMVLMVVQLILGAGLVKMFY